MRIALRTSGGRGEYEMVGSHGNISVSDVIDHHIQIQLFPGQIIGTSNWIRRVQGKPRIRLTNPRLDRHLYLVLADVLLMPKPKRELGITPGGKLQLTANNYSVISIQFDVLNRQDGSLTIQPTDLILSNSDGDLARIDILERLRIVLDIWAKASIGLDELSRGIIRHRDAVLEGNLSQIRKTASNIRESYDIDDPLREIIQDYSLADEYTYWAGTHIDDAELVLIDDDDTPPAEAYHERIKEWRLQASRGAKGVRFSRGVKEVYNNTCLFSGYYLPKSAASQTSGVDAAHILPWAQYDIDSISNGICLNKLCHWAFDSGILRLRYIETKSVYELTLSDKAKEAEKNNLITLDGFRPLEGYISKDRLPADRNNWPSPAHLEKFNASINL